MKTLLFLLLTLPTPEISKEDWFASHVWHCSTDMECETECRRYAEKEGIDTDICSIELDKTNE